jgi:CheY-like chemotaxis protein
LLNNAIKFTEHGEVVVGVKRTKTQQDVDDGLLSLHIIVRDTGIGIPQEQRDRLFHSFSQVDSSTARRYGGTGLGLAISKRLTELMSGNMWVESEVSKGSTFHFTIQTEVGSGPAPAYLRPRQPDLRGKRVLIVDDSATARRILQLRTRAWGMHAKITGSPLKALSCIRQGMRFDVAILDLLMPEMNGLELAAELRHLRTADDLPLVMLTSVGKRELNQDADLFAAYLTKPVKASQLYNTLTEILATTSTPIRRPDKQTRLQFDPEMALRLPLRILLVEDNITNQKLALYMLKRLGYQADLATNGTDAINAVRNKRYDVVLMDVQMPEMDGLEATRAIVKEMPNGQRPNIIAMTANAMSEDRQACLEAGMDGYLSKPIRVEELVTNLKDSYSKAMNGSEPSQAQSNGEGVLDVIALRKLDRLVGDDPEFLVELIEIFLMDTPKLLSDLRRATSDGDAGKVRLAAHTIKSNAASFGAECMCQLCRELEDLGRIGKLGESAETLLARIEAAYSQVELALKEMAKQGVVV